MNSSPRSACPASSAIPAAANNFITADKIHPGAGNRFGIILAGGDGARLRTLTRFISGDDRPKQFCSFFGNSTLMENSLMRAERSVPAERIVVALTAAHKNYYTVHLKKSLCHRVVQPSNRGTAPPLMCALLRIGKIDPAATVAVFPSHHHYSDEAAFTASLESAFELAEASDSVVLMGAPANAPETEYGWIETGNNLHDSALQVIQLHEKPPMQCAERLLEEGALWNTFVMAGRVSSFLEMAWNSVPKLMLDITSGVKHIRQSCETVIPDALYAEIQAVDFSRQILSPNAHRLIAFRLRGVQWHDLGDPEHVLSTVLNSGNDLPGWAARWRDQTSTAQPVPAPAPDVRGSECAAKGGLILVVDDSHDIRILVRKFLEADGYSVLTASDGEEGLRLYAAHQSRIGLLLTDVHMRGMTGFELAGRVLNLCSDLPVLFMSGDARGVDMSTRCIAKPFRRLDLLQHVRESLVRAATVN